MNKKLLIEWSGNWADEMDLDGFQIVSEKAWTRFLELLHEVDDKEPIFPWEFCVGTNEHVEYESKQDFLDSLEITPISDSEVNVISEKLGRSYGFMPLGQIYERMFYDHSDEDMEKLEWLAEEIC